MGSRSGVCVHACVCVVCVCVVCVCVCVCVVWYVWCVVCMESD